MNDFNDLNEFDCPSNFIVQHKIQDKIDNLQNHKQLETVFEESMEQISTQPSLLPRCGTLGRSLTFNLRNAGGNISETLDY